MPSVDKALRVLTVLAEAGPDGMALGQIAAQLGVGKSSLHVTLAALRHRQFVTQLEPSANYYLGPAVGRLSQTYLRSYDIRAILHAALVRLVDRIDEVVHIAVLDGTEVVYVDKISSLKPIQPGTSIGARMPALTTALGRAILAAGQMDFNAFKRRFDGRLVQPNRNSPKTIEEAWERVSQARQRGFAVDLEENVLGLMAVAVAILNGDQPVAAVSIVTLASECGPEGPIEHVPELKAILARELKPPLRIATASE